MRRTPHGGVRACGGAGGGRLGRRSPGLERPHLQASSCPFCKASSRGLPRTAATARGRVSSSAYLAKGQRPFTFIIGKVAARSSSSSSACLHVVTTHPTWDAAWGCIVRVDELAKSRKYPHPHPFLMPPPSHGMLPMGHATARPPARSGKGTPILRHFERGSAAPSTFLRCTVCNENKLQRCPTC